MSVYVSGGLILGCDVSELNFSLVPFGEDPQEFFNADCRLHIIRPHCDASWEECCIGMEIDECPVSGDFELFDSWVSMVKRKSVTFERLTGAIPRITGMQRTT